MKKILLATTALICLCTTSCLKNQDPEPTPYTILSGIYVLNNGNWGSNDANIVSYDYNTKAATQDIFFKANDKNLGDLGQDALVNGSKIYIAVSNSGIVFVTDLEGKILKEIKAGPEGNYQPRSLATDGANVYISYYEGYVGRIDTVDFNLTLSSRIGNNPEGICVCNSKLFVAVSNGLNYPDFDSTVVILSPKSLAVDQEVTVGLNPGKIVSCMSTVYCLCKGNYGDVPSSLSIIYKTTEGDYTAYTSPYVSNPTFMCSDNYRYLFIMTENDSNKWVVSYDAFLECVHDTSFIKDDTVLDNNVCSIDIDPVNYALFVGTSDYKNTGDMYVFNQYGHLCDKFDTNGLNPIRTIFKTSTIYY